MASIEIEIAARKYLVSCRDGEETHLRSVAAIVDRKAQEASAALGNLTEARQLLFASLLLADEIKEHRSGTVSAQASEPDPAVAEALEQLAQRMEKLADALEGSPTGG
ncbi:cell division protein ZapA [Sphingosinicella rhizophila]|uniref:Cell division protein ZapA n=1 Tax=Sphingosinicella rhizophila TaxID=3050082 RepID=A0ABU3Q215_9SPHN|nr:cell division protein ZapA [Sphingosinicella sp. GR2756]MDT9597461.1 cell division protein ZapA [Sphingosinicella sp. GR2756]